MPDVTIDLAGHPFEGSNEARLAVVEVSDYQCPYCARHTRDTYPRLKQDFIANGKVRYLMLDFPLRNHPFAFKAAEAATCAADKGKFWEMHHLLFENQNALDPAALPAYAEQIGLDRAEFDACLSEGRQQSVNADLAQAIQGRRHRDAHVPDRLAQERRPVEAGRGDSRRAAVRELRARDQTAARSGSAARRQGRLAATMRS